MPLPRCRFFKLSAHKEPRKAGLCSSLHLGWPVRFLGILSLCLITFGSGGAQEAPPAPNSDASSPSADAATPPLVTAAPAQVARLSFAGKLLPADSAETVKSFLDLQLPGPWDEQTQARVQRDLDALGYRATYELIPLASGEHELRISLQPMRVVRRIYTSGKWPLFTWEVLSYISWRVGHRLPEGAALAAEIRRQEQELSNFLARSGYYNATARILLDWAPESPEQVDVHVQIHLNAGFLRLRHTIGNIHAEGLHLLNPSQLSGFFNHCCLWFGRTSTERINDDIKRLIEFYQGKGYIGVRIKREIHLDPVRKKIDLDLTIDERKRVILHFTGRRSIPEKDLLKPDVMTPFRDNYASANELDESARNIFKLYQSRGFFDARVSWRWLSRTGNPAHVEFAIHEGPQLKVREIDFVPDVGSPPLSFPQSRLSDQITLRRYPRLGVLGLGQGGFASAVQLEQDARRIEDFYRREGHPRPHVTVEVTRSQAAQSSLPLLGLETALGASPDDADLYVRFRIAEGRREQVASVEISFTGPHSQSEAQVRKVLALKAGDPYTPETLEADKQRLGELMSSIGHPYAVIDPTSSTWDATHTRVNIRWVIDERELVRFGPIVIRGNFITRPSVILRELPFRTGDPYDSRKLLIAQQNLIGGRQIFTSARVQPNPGETDEFRLEARQKHWTLRRNPVPILVEVTERYDSAGELGVFVGVSTDDPLYGTASYTWRNLLGRGAEIEARGELGVRVQALIMRFTQPRLGSPFVRFDLRGFWRNDNRASIGLVNSYGANAELTRFFAPTDEQGRRLPPTLRLFTRLEFNFSQILVPLLRPEGTSDVREDGDRTQSLKLSFGIVWDRRVGLEAPALRQRNLPVPPNPLLPISGYLLSAQITGALCCDFRPFSFSAEGSFLAFATQAVLLRPFGPELRAEDGWPFGMRRFSLKMNLRVNYGIPLGPRPSLPLVERFFAGGDTSTRGYDLDALKSEEVLAPVGALAGDLGYRVVPQGGSVRILSQIEWEFTITPKLFGWPWVGALFLDTGAVFDGFQQLRWNDVRFSVGVSLLRLLTQFGAISFDYAYPLTLPGQDPLLQSEHWKHESWYQHFPGRIHFNWGMPISL